MCGVLLVVLSIAYVFMFGVHHSRAAETLACMRICEMGVSPCLPTSCALAPTVITSLATLITTSSALGHGTVLSDGGGAIIERGIVVATTTDPTVNDHAFAATTTSTGPFSVSITGLSQATNYFARAYATNVAATGYGTTTSFTTLGEGTPTPPPAVPPAQTSGGGGGGTTPPSTPQSPSEPTPLPPALPNTSTADNSPLVVTPEQSGMLTADTPAGKVFVEVPPNAVLSDTTFTVIPNPSSDTTAYLVPATTQLVNEVFYDISAQDAYGNAIHSFAHPITITLPIPAGLIQSKNLRVYWLDTANAKWVLIPEATFSGAQARFIVDHLTVFAIFETARPAASIPVAVPPKSPIIGGVQQSRHGAEHTYAVDFNILNSPEAISRDGYINLKTDIVSPVPGRAEQVHLTYTIYDMHGLTVFSQEKDVFVKDAATDYSRAMLKNDLPAGSYRLEVQLSQGDHTVVSIKDFEVRSPKVLTIPVAAITLQASRATMQGGIGTLSLALASLLFFMYCEYQASKRAAGQIDDADLLRSGMIS